MRLPEINSRSMRILQHLRKRPMTLDQGIESHGVFSSKKVPEGIERTKILELYCDLIDRDCIVKDGISYRLTLACRYKLEKMDLRCKPDHPQYIVLPPYRNAWTPEMQPGRMSKVVRRET